MKSIIICEGLTDCLFTQYYMIKVNDWLDKKEPNIAFLKWKRLLEKESNKLIIGHNGSSSRLVPTLDSVIKSNKIGVKDEIYNKIVMITDRDDDESESSTINAITAKVTELDGKIKGKLENNQWIELEFVNHLNETINFSFLLLTIPLDSTGAIEKVLLDSIAKKDSYDKDIVEKSKNFVQDADIRRKYLNKRRHKLKAWFNVFFSIRVPEDFYTERRRIFMEFPWEKNTYLRDVFSKLDDLN